MFSSSSYVRCSMSARLFIDIAYLLALELTVRRRVGTDDHSRQRLQTCLMMRERAANLGYCPFGGLRVGIPDTAARDLRRQLPGNCPSDHYEYHHPRREES